VQQMASRRMTRGCCQCQQQSEPAFLTSFAKAELVHWHSLAGTLLCSMLKGFSYHWHTWPQLSSAVHTSPAA
jgi:hypothetical protein